MNKTTYTYIDATTNEELFTETSRVVAWKRAVDEIRNDDRLGHNIQEWQNRTKENEGVLGYDFVLTKYKNGSNRLCHKSALEHAEKRHAEVIARQDKIKALQKAKKEAIAKVLAKFNKENPTKQDYSLIKF